LEEPTVYKLYIQPGMKVLLVIIFIAIAGIGAAIALAPSFLQGPKVPPPLVGLLLLTILVLYLYWILCLPYRLTLSQDGALEFISVLRRRTVRAEEIKSIQPDSRQVGFLVVKTDRRKIRILAQFDGFHDFLTRLKAMHPGVELRGC
jgi:hypothetical protein